MSLIGGTGEWGGADGECWHLHAIGEGDSVGAANNHHLSYYHYSRFGYLLEQTAVVSLEVWYFIEALCGCCCGDCPTNGEELLRNFVRKINLNLTRKQQQKWSPKKPML
jgi:hypothetical protein